MRRFFLIIILFIFFIGFMQKADAQSHDSTRFGPNDTIKVAAVFYDNEWMPYSEMPMAYITNGSYDKMAKILDEYNRLRNAVYVTYPYARTAGYVINDVNFHLQGMSKSERRKYIKSR